MLIFKSGGMMMIVALCCTLRCMQCRKSNAGDPWHHFKEKYGKKYVTSDEEDKRKQIFVDNFKKINQHNDIYKTGGRSFELGVNEYTDMTSDEMPNMSWRPYDSPSSYEGWRGLNITPIQFEATGAVLPDHVDWREKGVVSPVKHQHSCLGCYAFVATDAIESQHALKYGKHLLLSQQQLIDCSELEGNLGCKGGMVDWTYKYILRAKGVQYYEDYPYVLKKSECRFNSSKIAASITNYGEIKNGSEVSLQEAVAFYGPISASISTKDFGWNYYTEGIYDNPNCPTDVDHSVLVVGYGTENKTDYWLVKNSYGESFGNKGYIKMSRNKGNQCAIASYANFPVLGKWEPFSPGMKSNGGSNVRETTLTSTNLPVSTSDGSTTTAQTTIPTSTQPS